MRLKKEMEKFETHMCLLLEEIDIKVDRLLGRMEMIELLKEEIALQREEKKKLLDRFMSRDFETYQTYSGDGKEETVGEDIKPEEDPDMAGEIFRVTE